jgi:hypothetical protein
MALIWSFWKGFFWWDFYPWGYIYMWIWIWYGYDMNIYIWDFYPSWDFHYQQYDMWICGLFWKCWGKSIVKNIMKKPCKLPGKSCI